MKQKRADQDYEAFKEYFMSNIMEDCKLESSEALNEMVGKQFGRPFLIYNDGHQDYFAMNVKYMGMGNWKVFNDHNRASERGFTEQDYYDHLQIEKEGYYEFLDDLWFREYGIHISALGRSAGYIGVPVRDLVSKNYATVFMMNDDKVKALYNDVKDENDDPYDQGYEASCNVLEEDIPDTFKFSYDFDSFVNKFKYSVESTSEEWTTKKWNDDLFDKIFH